MEEIEALASLQDVPSTTPYGENPSIVEMVRLWGGSTTDAVLDPAMTNFQLPGINGFIAYRMAMKCAIVFGDPICAAKDKELLAKAFHHFMDENGYRPIYIAASQEYAHWAIENVCGSIVEFGEELFFNHPHDPRKNTGSYGSLVRRKTKQALRSGITIHEYIPHDLAVENAIEEVKMLWLQSRKGLQVHISNVHLFTNRTGKRWLYAKQGDRIIGAIVLNELRSQNGWHINHLMVTPEAPNGVPELLMTTVLEMLEKEGCPFATVGSIAGHRLGEIKGLGQFFVPIARAIFKIASTVTQLNGLNTFWGKFHPQSKPSYLLFSRKKIGIGELMGLKKALNGSTNE